MQFIKNSTANLYFLLLAIFLISSCTTAKKIAIHQPSTAVKNYPVGKPFVYNNKIIINGTIDAKEKLRLTTELSNYWDDSLQVRKKSKFGFFDGEHFLYTKIIDKPPVFDSINFVRSIKFMDNYLKSQGYYAATIARDTVSIHKKKQHRVMPIATINLGKNITIDSVAFDLLDSNLQKLAQNNKANTLLKKGGAYTKQIISNELGRLTNLFSKNGYYNFRRDDIYALVDTTDSKFLNLTIDPFELTKLLDEYAKSKLENPKWDITIKQRKDTTGLSSKKYYIGQIYYYPQAGGFDLIDTIMQQPWLHNHQTNNYTLKFDKEIIKLAPLVKYTFLKNGEPYNQTNLFNTVNALSKLGAWKQVDSRFVIRATDSLDLHIAMVPEKKYGIENTGEISKNTGDLTAGNLVGLSLNFTFRNRNVWKQAIQSFTSFRTGVEFNPNDSSKALQTFYANVGHTYSFPKMIAEKPINWLVNAIPIKFIKSGLNDILSAQDKRTLLSFNASYSDRLDLFRLRSLTGTFGYEFKKEDKVWLYSPINVELYSLDKLQGLYDLIKQNPFLQLSFNTGNVIGQTFTFYQSYTNKKHSNRTHFFRVGIEESGLFFGMFKSLQENVYRYGKIELEYRESSKYKNSEVAYKLFGGVGFNYSKSNNIGDVLPFFKQFFVGGPNSMRAWGLRQLGQGSSLLNDTSSSSFKDRFGDIKIEGNFEYRFNVYSSRVVKIGSALFADVGNVWNLKHNDANANSEFNFNRFYKDVAIAIGTGLRLDFTIFLVRLDVAYKLKDPAREYNDGWINLKTASLKEYRGNGVEVKNIGFQLGIGLPF